MPGQSTNQGPSPQSALHCCILGTAGHIDHGKSALVKALTGTDPDRLPEEKARGMTIELGFAQLSLPAVEGRSDGVIVGMVDVPGHERFIKTMVAGATGIDLAMLVVAADDGVMPQTREHVEILDLLGVRAGLVVLSKADLVPEDRCRAVRSQVVDLVTDTALAGWPVQIASAKTGQGLSEIREAIGALVRGLPPSREDSIFRLAIDRVFPIHGRGTVVTGSVLAGRVNPGAALELLPAGLPCKVREIQSFGRAAQNVAAGERAALNLTGIDRDKIERGMELATPGYLAASRYVDACVRVLPRRTKPLISHQRIRVCMGTSELMASAVVIGESQVSPGAEALVQVRFDAPSPAAFGQRFIIRNENAQSTLGGGRVVRPFSRRFGPRDSAEQSSLRRACADDPIVRLDEAARHAGFDPPTANRLACATGIDPESVEKLRQSLRASGKLTRLGADREVHIDTIAAAKQRTVDFLKRHHQTHSLEPGLLRDRLIGWLDRRTAPGCGRQVFALIESAGLVVNRGPYVADRQFRPALSAEDAALLESLVVELARAGYDPPPWASLKTVAGLSKQRSKVLEEIAKSEPRLAAFAPGCYISADAIAGLKQVVGTVSSGRPFKLAQVRDALGASRRVVQPLLEYLDRIQFTRRVGDERIILESTP